MKAKSWLEFINDWNNKGPLSTKQPCLIIGRWESASGSVSPLGTCYCLMSRKRYWALWTDWILCFNEISTLLTMEQVLRI